MHRNPAIPPVGPRGMPDRTSYSLRVAVIPAIAVKVNIATLYVSDQVKFSADLARR
jgi:hypothetical protein